MTVTTTYPGVYIQEIPSGSRTIVGVATSITAFIGRASRGPVNEPVAIAGFGDFERVFGGLWLNSALGYAIQDFYNNGGRNALVVRVVDAAAVTAQLDVDGLTLQASGEGAWANVLQVDVTHSAGADATDIATAQGVTANDLFSIVVREGPGVDAPSETYLNVTTVDGPRRVDLVLASSRLVQLLGNPPTTRPRDGSYALVGLDVDSLRLVPRDATLWSNGITAEISHHTAGDAAADAAAADQGVPVADLFTLKLSTPGTTEPPYQFVTIGPDGNRIDDALADSGLARTGPLPTAKPAVGTYQLESELDVGGLSLVAKDATLWSNGMKAVVTHPTGQDADAEAAAQGVTVNKLFTLVLSTPDTTETYEFVTVGPDGDRIDVALANSALARVDALPKDRPNEATTEYVHAPRGVFGADGGVPTPADYIGSADPKTGIHALLKAELFNLLCIPPPTPAIDLDPSVWAAAAAFCTDHRAFLLVDPPELETVNSLPTWVTTTAALTGSTMRNAAIYFPRIRRPDPLRGGATATFAACGAVAGTYARTDGARGVWKAPAGTDAGLAGVVGLRLPLTDYENGTLNPLGINCLRTFRIGTVVWGARTLRGSDLLADEYKYVPVRRLALFLEETLYRNTQWVVFEPNDEPLWSQIRASIGAFMQDLFRRGAFQGITPRDAYFVRCDRDTTTQYDIDRGIVNILVGFAPLKPAEFVIISIQQKTASATA